MKSAMFVVKRAQFGCDDRSFCGDHLTQYLKAEPYIHTDEEIIDIGNGSNADANSFGDFVQNLIASKLISSDIKAGYWDEADTSMLKVGNTTYDIGELLKQENPERWKNVKTTSRAYVQALCVKALKLCKELGVTMVTDLAFEDDYLPVEEFFANDLHTNKM